MTNAREVMAFGIAAVILPIAGAIVLLRLKQLQSD
jgi:hypothetical protein